MAQIASVTRLFLLVGVFLLTAQMAWAMTIARDGEAQITIVQPDAPKIYEQTAVADLGNYLEDVTGAVFQPVPESEFAGGPAIYVGNTVFAREKGIDIDALGREEWVIRTVRDGRDESLILAGGGSRGTLYAVYRFLEFQVGVRWWTALDTFVPDKPTLVVPRLNDQDEPDFVQREWFVVRTPDVEAYNKPDPDNDFMLAGAFSARNRINRNGPLQIHPKYGGVEGFGPPRANHTFYSYFPPKEYFDEHPQWYSLIDGERQHHRAQLALTNEQLRAAWLEKMKGYIEQSREWAEENQTYPPMMFDISANDWGGWDQSPEAQKFYRGESGFNKRPIATDYVMDFVNHMADGIREEYPDVQINTLAYVTTVEPPSSPEFYPRDNVVIRFCTVGERAYTNYLSPIYSDDTPDVQTLREHFLKWAEAAEYLQVWDYMSTYRSAASFPLATTWKYPSEFKWYKQHGVQGFFLQFAAQQNRYIFQGDRMPFKMWIAAKLMEDLDQDYNELVDTWMQGYFGPAAPYMKQHLELTKSRCDQLPERKRFMSMLSSPPRYADMLNLPTLIQMDRLFEKAEAAVADQPEYLQRVKMDRLGVDAAIILLSGRLADQTVDAGMIQGEGDERQGEGVRGLRDAFDMEQVLNRYEATYRENIERWVEPYMHDQFYHAFDKQMKQMRALATGETDEIPSFFPYPLGRQHIFEWP